MTVTKSFTIAAVLAFAALTAAAQTNLIPDLACCFHIPETHLYVETEESNSPDAVTVPVLPETTSNPVSLEATLDDGVGEFPHVELIRVIPEDSSPGEVIGSMFRPEQFHLGKTVVSCSIATAIKRRNPLCLLNPIVLSVSW